MNCYLVRHGKDDDSVRGGWSNTPLTTEGMQQAACLATEIQRAENIDIGIIYSSDLPRARQTAEIIASVLSVPVINTPDFRETNNGILAGMKNQTALKKYPGLYWNALDWDTPYPGGESPRQFYERISQVWHSFKRMIHDEKHDVLLVTHGGVLNVIQCIEHGIPYTNKVNPFPMDYASMVCVEI